MLRKIADRRRSGTTIVETAFVLPLFFMFIFGILEYGRYMLVRNVMDNAAREGARYAVVNTATGTTTTVTNAVLAKFPTVTQQFTAAPTIQVYAADSTGEPIASKLWSDAKFGEPIGVRITGTYKSLLFNLLFLPSSFTMTSTALMKSEAN